MPGSEEAKAHPECAFPFVGARSALSYEGGAKDIIRAYKDEDELRLDTVIASFICNAMRGRTAGKAPSEAKAPADWTQWADALVYVPASPEALRRRGFDHMERIAQICGERTGLPVLNALTCKEGILDQRDLGRTQRQANRSESFETNPKVSVHNKRIVLIDDVFTTGATASAATTTLLSAGAPAVTTTTYARVW